MKTTGHTQDFTNGKGLIFSIVLFLTLGWLSILPENATGLSWLKIILGAGAFGWSFWTLASLIFPATSQTVDRVIALLPLSILGSVGFISLSRGTTLNLDGDSALVYLATITFVSILIKHVFGKKFLTALANDDAFAFNKKDWQGVGLIWMIYGGITTLILLSYPFLREVDSYYFKSIVDTALTTGSYPTIVPFYLTAVSESYEQGLQSLLILLNLISGIATFDLFKFGVLALGIYIFPIYAVAKLLTKNRKISWLTSFLTLSLPILLLEISVLRPQSLLFVLLPALIYFWIRFQASRSANQIIYYFGVALLLTGAIKYTHTIYLLILPLLFIMPLIKFWHKLLTNWRRTLAMVGIAVIIGYPYLIIFRVFDRINYFLDGFFSGQLKFDDFFRAPFSPVTYGVNLAVVVPILALISIVLIVKKRTDYQTVRFAPVFYVLAIFFAFLEFFPRLGISIEPGRSFPYVGLFLCLLVIPALKWLRWRHRNIESLLLIGLVGASMGLSLYINFLPQYHIVNQKEVDAFQKIINPYDEPVLVITPRANNPIVVGYTDGLILAGEDERIINIFKTDSADESLGFMKYYRYYYQSLTDSAQENEKALVSVVREAIHSEDPSAASLIGTGGGHLAVIGSSIGARNENLSRNIKAPKVVLVHSSAKDKSFLNRFQWFQDKWLPQANLNKFDHHGSFRPIYQDDQVRAWEIVQ